MRRAPIAALAAVLLASVCTLPAQADGPNMTICNSSASDSTIEMYRLDTGSSIYLSPDECGTLQALSPVRVDVNPFGSSISSYKLGVIGNGYGPCHNSNNSASNPPDDDGPDGVRYRTYNNTGC